MIYIAICDDNQIHLEYIREQVISYLDSHRETTQLYCLSPLALFEQLEQNTFLYDIVILDIELSSEKTGIQTAEEINRTYPNCLIIFLSGYPKYMMDVYDTEHIYFISKDRMQEYLPKALDKAFEQLSDMASTSIFIKTQKSHLRLCLHELIYAERISRKTYIHTIHETYEITDDISHFFAECASYTNIVRCHNSFIINLKFVTSFTRTSLILQGNITIPISRRYIEPMKQAFFNYLKNT